MQIFRVMFEAADYSSVYGASYVGSLYGNASVNSTVVVQGGGGAIVTSSLTVRKELPVTVTRSTPQICRSYGDPHISTFDRMAYGFQLPGVCTCVGGGRAGRTVPALQLHRIVQSRQGGHGQ